MQCGAPSRINPTLPMKDKALLYKVENTWTLECLWPRQLIRRFTSAKEARLWANQRHIVVSRVPDCDS